VRAEAVAESYVFGTNQTIATLVVSITVAVFSLAGTTQRAVVIVAWIQRARIFHNYTNIYVPPEVETTSQILATAQPGGTLLVAVTIPLALFTRTTE
jgi:hypothetical protein